MAATSKQLIEIQKRVESIPGTAVAQELKTNAEALLQQPENAALHFGVGLLYARVGDFASSAKMLMVSLNLTGNNEVILRSLAYLYANKVGDHEIALDYLKKLHKLDKKDSTTNLLMATSLLQLQRADEALSYLQKGKPTKAQSIHHDFLLAQSYIQLEQAEEAKNCIQRITREKSPAAEPMLEILEKQLEVSGLK